MQNNITIVNGTVIIDWHIPAIPKGATIYGYYLINNPNHQLLLKYIQTSFVSPSQLTSQQVLRIVDLKVPTFYQNASANVNVKVLYTGAIPQPVTFTLSSLSGVSIYPSYITLNATPNQVLAQSFAVMPTETGTQILTLVVSTSGANITYPITILTLPQSPSSSATPSGAIASALFFNRVAITAVAVLLIIAFVVSFILLRRRMTKSRIERSSSLIGLREQIKREEENEGTDQERREE
jgi:hypothetical protein